MDINVIVIGAVLLELDREMPELEPFSGSEEPASTIAIPVAGCPDLIHQGVNDAMQFFTSQCNAGLRCSISTKRWNQLWSYL